MSKSQIVNLTWSFQTNGNGNSNNLWPELCQTNQVRHPARKKELKTKEESNDTVNLNSTEYPELSRAVVKSKNTVAEKGCYWIPPSPVKNTRSIRMFKRSNKISVNIQEALERVRCMTKISEDLPKFRINIYKGGSSGTTNPMMRNPSWNVRKVRVPKPTRLKRIILCNRDIKVQINVQKREEFERAKVEAICKDVDAINFNSLRITADREIDVDCVNNMCTMTLYDNDYRLQNVENISENSVYYRPDIIKRISDLRIQNRPMIGALVGTNARHNPFRINNDAVENDIVKQTLSLQIKDDIKQEIKQEIQDESEDSVQLNVNNFLMYSRNFREYCTNILTPGFTNALETFLREITRLQKRYHERNPNKSLYKRRYYSGLKETRKHCELKKLKFVIVAPNIEKVELEGGLDDEVSKLLSTCSKENVTVCFGMTRRKLGHYTHGRGFVGCVGIANYSGTEEIFKTVLIELAYARNAFTTLTGAKNPLIDISKSISDECLLSENIAALLRTLSSNHITLC